MKYLSILTSALVIFVGSHSLANAQQSRHYGLYNSPSLFEALHRGCQANQMWPSQYVPTARRSVLSAYDVMVNNGWRRQNLLGAYHFDPDSNQLTEAGKLKVKWILSQAPPIDEAFLLSVDSTNQVPSPVWLRSTNGLRL